MAGYSGTPLAKKLGISSGTRIHVVAAPENYLELLSPLPEDVQVVSRVDERTDIVHIFSVKRALLSRGIAGVLAKLRPDAAIWVSWPKKSSKVPTDIVEDAIRDIALPLGLVDIKVCAVDETWSGLKLVLRKERRRGKTAAGKARA
jgi:hypothetical protein